MSFLNNSILKTIIIISIISIVLLLLYSQYKKLDKKNSQKGASVERFGYTILRLDFDSKYMQQLKQVNIFLPHDYQNNTTNNYPVVYKTDGIGQMEHWLNSIHVLAAAGVAPKPIFVSIDTSKNRSRQLLPDFLPQDPFRDSTAQQGGQASRLLDFIKHELIPNIETRYKTNNTRILAGHSFGALFTLYAFIEDPNLFSGYIATSPSLWVKQGAILENFNSALHNNAEIDTYFYFSMGANERAGFLPEQERKNLPNLYRTLATQLTESTHQKLRWRFDLHPNTDHKHSPIPSIPSALVDFFKNYRAKTNIAASSDSLTKDSPLK